MRGIVERVVGERPVAGRHGIRLGPDRDHGVDKAINLGEVLALSRLDHEGACDRERHRRRVEAEVDEAFGHVIHGDTRGLGEGAKVEDALVRDEAVIPRVQHGEVVAQPQSHIVGGENRRPCGLLEAIGAHHAHVGPADRQDARRAIRSSGDGRAAVQCALCHRMPGEEGGEVRLRRDGTDTRPPATVRDAEGLVQVQVRDIAAEVAVAGESQHGIEVRTVDVDLAARVMHGLADGADLVLVHAVRRGVGDHQRGQGIRMLGDLGSEVIDIHIAKFVTGHHDDTHAGKHCGGGIRAMGALRDQTHSAITVAAGSVIATDGEKPGELALAARIGLKGHRVVAGHVGEPALQLHYQLQVALDIRLRREGVQSGELRPGDGLHLGGRVELHRARSERDHTAIKRVVIVGEVLEIAHHRRLGAVRVEHRMGEVLAGAQQVRRDPVELVRHRVVDELLAEDARDGAHVIESRGLVCRELHMIVVDEMDEIAGRMGPLHHSRGTRLGVQCDGVEEVGRVDRVTGLRRGPGKHVSEACHSGCDLLESLRAVVDGIHGRHDGEQHLGGADVRRGLVATDVLLAHLEREAVGGMPGRVLRDTNEAPGQLAFEARAHGHVARVRTTEAHGHAEALAGAHGDIRPQLARRGDEGESKQIGGDDGEGALRLRGGDNGARIPDVARAGRVLHEDAEGVGEFDHSGVELRKIDDDKLDADRRRAVLEQSESLGQGIRVDDEGVAVELGSTTGQHHSLDDGRTLVEH